MRRVGETRAALLVLLISLVPAACTAEGAAAAAGSGGGGRSGIKPACRVRAGSGERVIGGAQGSGRAQERSRTKGDPQRKGVTRELQNPTRDMDSASRLMRDGRYAEAISVLEQIVIGYPQILAAAEMLAECYLKNGMSRTAAAFLESKLQENPGHFNFIRDLGYVYIDLGQREKAVEAWNRALTGDESSAVRYGSIAKLEQDAGMFEEALATLRAGRRFERHFVRYTMEIIRLERVLGRSRVAFREGIALIAATQKPTVDQAAFIFDVFRDTGRDQRLLSSIDTLVAAGSGDASFLRMIRALLMVEAGMYDEAWMYIGGGEGAAPGEKELYTVAGFLAGMGQRRTDERFGDFFQRTLDEFIKRYGASTTAPAMLFMAAEYKRRCAHVRDKPDPGAAPLVVALADSVLGHPLGAPYREKASLLKASVLLEEMHEPAAALEALDRVRFRDRDEMLKAQQLKLRALLASSHWELAEKRLSGMAKEGDSTVAILGEYGLGRLQYLKGDYSAAVASLAGFAKRHAWSAWANDALDTAIMIQSAVLHDEQGALDLIRCAQLSAETGKTAEAIDSLEAVQTRYPYSSLVPDALYLKAELSERTGRLELARTGFSYVAERFPLHELAPRAMERVAAMMEADDPGEAVQRYRTIIERYPDDPFLERVRSRYIALRKAIENVPRGEGGRE